MLVVGTRVMPWLLERSCAPNRASYSPSRSSLRHSASPLPPRSSLGCPSRSARFFAGIVVNESDHSHRAAEQAKPLEDAFAVLFFLSVGMLFDPGILVRHPYQVLAVLAVILLGKSIAAFAIVRIAGYPAVDRTDRLGEPGADRRILVHAGRPRHVAQLAERRGSESDPRRRADLDHPEPSRFRYRQPHCAAGSIAVSRPEPGPRHRMARSEQPVLLSAVLLSRQSPRPASSRSHRPK